MTEKTLYDKLSNILETIDAEKYTDIVSIIECNIEGDGTVYMDAFDFACELHNADGAEVLPKEVAGLMIEIYLEEISKENPNAMTNLGSLYYTGRCGEQNYEKAVKYYTMADKHGERQATENLGYCYYYGRTGEVDYKKAYHYFVKGALDNHLNSLCKIGDMYKNGYYVEKDEKEGGLRKVLNFGHTYAHAVEYLTKYKKYTHGEAVSIGMKLIFDLSKEIKIVDDKYYNEAISLLNDYSLLTKLSDEFEKEEFYNAMKSDKKVADKKINFVMPKGRKKVQLKSNIDKNDVLKGII